MKKKGVYRNMEGVGKALKRMGFGKSGEGFSEGVWSEVELVGVV